MGLVDWKKLIGIRIGDLRKQKGSDSGETGRKDGGQSEVFEQH